MSAGGNGRDTERIEILLILQATVKDLKARMERAEAEAVKLSGMVKALGGRVLALESTQPSPKPEPLDAPDNAMPSEADRAAMRERLRVRQAEGMAKHRKLAASREKTGT